MERPPARWLSATASLLLAGYTGWTLFQVAGHGRFRPDYVVTWLATAAAVAATALAFDRTAGPGRPESREHD